jgi:hypothetical protein
LARALVLVSNIQSQHDNRMQLMIRYYITASVNFQMHSEEALFNQAILIGGSFLMMRPATEETAERLYKDISDELGLSDKSVEDRVKELETKPGESMLSNLTPALASLGPVVDGETVPAAATFAGLKDATGFPLPGYKWCKRVLVIDSQADVSTCSLSVFHMSLYHA